MGVLITCADYNITALTSEKTNDRAWHTWKGHKASLGYGDIALKLDPILIEGAGANTATIDGNGVGSVGAVEIENNGVKADTFIAKGAMGRPATVAIDHTLEEEGLASFTSEWLIYNKDADAVPSPFYKVRFKENAGWIGVGETGSVVGITAKSKKTRKMNW